MKQQYPNVDAVMKTVRNVHLAVYPYPGDNYKAAVLHGSTEIYAGLPRPAIDKAIASLNASIDIEEQEIKDICDDAEKEHRQKGGAPQDLGNVLEDALRRAGKI